MSTYFNLPSTPWTCIGVFYMHTVVEQLLVPVYRPQQQTHLSFDMLLSNFGAHIWWLLSSGQHVLVIPDLKTKPLSSSLHSASTSTAQNDLQLFMQLRQAGVPMLDLLISLVNTVVCSSPCRTKGEMHRMCLASETLPLVAIRKESNALLRPIQVSKQKCPKDICTYKRERNGTPWLHCSNCKQWYHCRCVGLTKQQAHRLPAWDCKICQ